MHPRQQYGPSNQIHHCPGQKICNHCESFWKSHITDNYPLHFYCTSFSGNIWNLNAIVHWRWILIPGVNRPLRNYCLRALLMQSITWQKGHCSKNNDVIMWWCMSCTRSANLWDMLIPFEWHRCPGWSAMKLEAMVFTFTAEKSPSVYWFGNIERHGFKFILAPTWVWFVPELGWTNGLANRSFGFTLVPRMAQGSTYSHNITSIPVFWIDLYCEVLAHWAQNSCWGAFG